MAFWTILFGWFLGWFTPLITEAYRKTLTEKELRKTIRIELVELQCRMAMAMFELEAKYRELDVGLLTIIKTVFDKYVGSNNIQGIKSLAYELLSSSDEQIKAYNNSRADKNSSTTLRKYGTPLLDSKLPFLSWVKEDFRNKLLELKTHLDMLEEIRQDSRSYSDLTFQNLSDVNRKAVNSNIVACYLQYSDRAKIIIRSIDNLNL